MLPLPVSLNSSNSAFNPPQLHPNTMNYNANINKTTIVEKYIAQHVDEMVKKVLHEVMLPHLTNILNEKGYSVSLEEMREFSEIPYCPVINHTGINTVPNGGKAKNPKGNEHFIEGYCRTQYKTGISSGRYCNNKATATGFCVNCSKKSTNAKTQTQKQNIVTNFNSVVLPPMLNVNHKGNNGLQLEDCGHGSYRVKNSDLVVANKDNSGEYEVIARLVNNKVQVIKNLTSSEHQLVKQYNLICNLPVENNSKDLPSPININSPISPPFIPFNINKNVEKPRRSPKTFNLPPAIKNNFVINKT